MIAKACDREIRRDSWFENRLVINPNTFAGLVGKVGKKKTIS